MDYLRKDIVDIINHVEINYEKILSSQNCLYESAEYKNNKVKLKRMRYEYFENAI